MALTLIFFQFCKIYEIDILRIKQPAPSPFLAKKIYKNSTNGNIFKMLWHVKGNSINYRCVKFRKIIIEKTESYRVKNIWKTAILEEISSPVKRHAINFTF